MNQPNPQPANYNSKTLNRLSLTPGLLQTLNTPIYSPNSAQRLKLLCYFKSKNLQNTTKHLQNRAKQAKKRQNMQPKKPQTATDLPKTASNQPYPPHQNPICNVHIHVKLEHSAIFHQTKHKNSHIKNNFLSHTKTQKHTFTQPNPQNGNQALCCITTGKQNQTPKCNVQF